jgi:nitroimidazol reductase NimA-like FMN-containing flavoprotein (pyridoxamine 5'-phosphate oxidase superfamily)
MHSPPSGAARTPEFRDLTRAEIDAVLSRNHVGRIAYSFRDRVDIRPIHYVYADGWIYGRTSAGDKVVTLRHNQWLAFETDEVVDTFEWRSVVVHGTFYALHEDGPPIEAPARERALTLLRRLVPGTLDADDPVPFRTVLFRISVDEASGREAMPGR